jgi:hypothetical protein
MRILTFKSSRFMMISTARWQYFKHIVEVILVVTVATMVCGCKPDYPAIRSQTLQTTISSDGLTVAVLESAGTDKQRLMIRQLERETVWRQIDAPRFTQTIRFGLAGNQLLLTHGVPPNGELVQLTRWNIGNLRDESENLLQAPDLAFPVEVADGRVLIRSRHISNAEAKTRIGGYEWLLLTPQKGTQVVSPKNLLPFPQPSIVGAGFFWFDRGMSYPPNDDQRRRVIAYPLPGGVAPSIDENSLTKDTVGLVCNHTGARCIREYLSNAEDRSKTFVYKLEARLGDSRCLLPDVSGYIDGISLTPSGNAAVLAVASKADQPRTVVVLRFENDKCLPVRVDKLSL